MSQDPKRGAAERAAEFVESGMVLGLGTGSTARHFLDVLSERVRDGALQDIVGVPTSRSTEWYAREQGLKVVPLDKEPRIDLAVDGADEIDPALDLIKGLGGALLWEKIVASAADRLIILGDESKLVERLGTKGQLPIEVVQFGWSTHLSFLDSLGAEPTLRRTANGGPFTTDSGNYILDCVFEGGIESPEEVEHALHGRVGIVESGLFLGMADLAVIGTPDGARLLEREK